MSWLCWLPTPDNGDTLLRTGKDLIQVLLNHLELVTVRHEVAHDRHAARARPADHQHAHVAPFRPGAPGAFRCRHSCAAALLSNNNPNFVANLAYVYAVSGERKHATEVLSTLQKTSKIQYVAPYQFAVIYSALGAKQKSYSALRKAFDERSPFLNNLYADTLPGGRLAGLRKEAELSRLLHALRLPEAAG